MLYRVVCTLFFLIIMNVRLYFNQSNIQFQGTVLVNNSDKPIKWAFDLSMPNKALELGILKFVHPSGVPFVVMGGEESKGIEGVLEPEKSQAVTVIFCPSM